MPRYFFNVQKDGRPPDSTGVELHDIEQARAEAAMLIGKEMQDHPDEFWNDEDWQVEVSDERGLILFTVFSSAIHGSSKFQSPSRVD